MAVDAAFLTSLLDAPSVGTACGPVFEILRGRFGTGWTEVRASDSFHLFHRAGSSPEQIRAVFVSHVDEIGGCVYGAAPGGGFLTRCWGAAPELFNSAGLIAMDYLAESGSVAFPVTSEVIRDGDEPRLVLHGDRIQPYRTAFTFVRDSATDAERVHGPALDPRATAYAVAEAVRALDDPGVAALFVMAEECAMDVARKAVVYLQRSGPRLGLVVNADVPRLDNLGDGDLDVPAIRIFEGRTFVDPAFGIRAADTVRASGFTEFMLSASRTSSQTILFAPLAPAISVAMPALDIHTPRAQMSLCGLDRCTRLLGTLGRLFIDDRLPFAHA